METMSISWKAIRKDNLWLIQDKDGQTVASVVSGRESKKNAWIFRCGGAAVPE